MTLPRAPNDKSHGRRNLHVIDPDMWVGKSAMNGAQKVPHCILDVQGCGPSQA